MWTVPILTDKLSLNLVEYHSINWSIFILLVSIPLIARDLLIPASSSVSSLSSIKSKIKKELNN